MKTINISRFLPAITWFFVVLVLLCMPGDDLPSAHWIQVIYFDKWFHAGIFGLLALLFMLPVALSPIKNKEKLQYFIGIAVATSFWGLTSEFIQKYWIPGRSFDLVDWLADSLGAFISLLICKKRYTTNYKLLK